jgi:hypothetical protein
VEVTVDRHARGLSVERSVGCRSRCPVADASAGLDDVARAVVDDAVRCPTSSVGASTAGWSSLSTPPGGPSERVARFR